MPRSDVRLRRRVLPWFSSIDQLDRARPYPFTVAPSRTKAQADAEVRAFVAGLLPGAVDEGSARALDPITLAWAGRWLEQVDTDHVEHLAVVERLVGLAEERVAAAEAAHDAATRRLRTAEADLLDARRRLGA